MNPEEIRQVLQEELKNLTGLGVPTELTMYKLAAVDSSKALMPSKDLHSKLKNCKGYYLDSNNATLMAKRGKFNLKINGRSFFSGDALPPARAAMSNHGVAPMQRFLPIGNIEGDMTVDFEYTDTDTSDTTFAAYEVYIFFIGEPK